MSAVPLPASPPDIAAIITNLGIFSLAIAAVIGGIYKGLKEIRKGGEENDRALAGGLIMDRASLNMLVNSNERLESSNRDILDEMRSIDRNVNALVEALRDQREMTRSHAEGQHRLRASIIDLTELMRRFRLI